MNITDSIFWIGVNDYKIELFEAQFVVEKGMAYNSYLVKGEKTAVFDAVEHNFAEQWLNNIDKTLNTAPDYLIVLHVEPDHSSSITAFMDKYKNAKIVSSEKAFSVIKNFYGTDYSDRRIIVKENDELDLGERKIRFIAAPMVHWPEVLMAYDAKEQVLFSADAFGKFGTTDADEDWACEARRYYFGIVGKFGAQVQNVLKKVATLSIKTICPLHGPMLTENLSYYIGLYNTWSSYQTETDGVAIFYTSVYGHTKSAALYLAKQLADKNCPKIAVNDLINCDMAEAVEDAFRYGKIVLATTTYNGGIFPKMKEFIDHLTEKNYQNKFIGIIENGSWAPTAAKCIRTLFENSKNITFTENTVKILSAMTDENVKTLDALCNELI